VTLAALGVLGLEVTIASVGVAAAFSLAGTLGWDRIIPPLAPPAAALGVGFLLASEVVQNWAGETQMLLTRADQELRRARGIGTGGQELVRALDEAAGDNARLLEEYWFRLGGAMKLFGLSVSSALVPAAAREIFGLNIKVVEALAGLMVLGLLVLWFVFETEARRLGASWRSAALFGRPGSTTRVRARQEAPDKRQ